MQKTKTDWENVEGSDWGGNIQSGPDPFFENWMPRQETLQPGCFRDGKGGILCIPLYDPNEKYRPLTPGPNWGKSSPMEL